MRGATQRILDEALELPEEDRRQLAETLLASIENGEEIELAWTREAILRAERVEAGEATPLDGQTSVTNIEKRVKKKFSILSKRKLAKSMNDFFNYFWKEGVLKMRGCDE